jgi:predicted ATPase
MAPPGSRVFTFLFSDIEGSTRRWQRDRDAMAAALAIHDETLVGVVEAHGGTVFKHTGDGTCSVFPSPRSALNAAAEAQSVLELPVRMGIHSGEAEERDGDFFGPTLNRCARLMDSGHGGQVLVSETVRSLLDDDPALMDLGEHLLRDLARPERVFQLGDGEFPALRHLSRAASLPSSLTSLMGREGLVDEVVERLGEQRLVTLVGVGGVGKTRVAVAAADRIASDNELTVFVDLASTSDGTEVVPVLARALSVSRPTLESVAVALTGRRVLLVVDNCEHVLEAAAEMVLEVMATGDSVRVLTTSREGLGVNGEHLLTVPGLAADAADSPAVALFVDRARAADSGFALDAGNAATVVEVCRRLDGIPLAIELAAARVSVMTSQELLDHLDQRFRILTRSQGRSVDRHRTLREAVDWSHQLLDPRSRDSFARLAVFASDFDLAAATAVLGAADEVEALELLGTLVDKSLLTSSRVDGQTRYRYLETIRSYAEEKLDATESSEAVKAGFNGHLADLVRSLVDEMFTSSTDVASRLGDEMSNLRRSFDWALDNNDVESATHLISPLLEVVGHFGWYIAGWADEILRLPGSDRHPARATLLGLRAVDVWFSGDFRALREASLDFVDVATERLDPVPWWVYLNHMLFMRLAGDDDAADDAGERLLAAAADEGPDVRLYCLLRANGLGGLDLTARARSTLLDDIERGRAHQSQAITYAAAMASVMMAQRSDDHRTMLERAREASDNAVEGSSQWWGSTHMQAWAYLELGDIPRAMALCDDVFDESLRYGYPAGLVPSILVYALVLRAVDEPEAAATLRGWLPSRMTMYLLDRFSELDGWLAESIAADRFDELTARGRHMAPIELKSLAAGAIGPHLDSP